MAQSFATPSSLIMCMYTKMPLHTWSSCEMKWWIIFNAVVELSSAFLLGRLRVGFVVTTNPIPNHGEGEFFEHVALGGSEVQQPPSQRIVVLSLFGSVVARGVLKVFFLIPEEIIFQLWILLPRELLPKRATNDTGLCSKTNMAFSFPLSVFGSLFSTNQGRMCNPFRGRWTPVMMIEMLDWFLLFWRVFQEKGRFARIHVGLWDVRKDRWYGFDSKVSRIQRHGSSPRWIGVKGIDAAVREAHFFHLFRGNGLELPEQLGCGVLIMFTCFGWEHHDVSIHRWMNGKE